MSFVSELKRRKVFQVAAVYLVVAWLIMQVVDVVNEPLRLPEWFATVAILIVAIGFPIALILSWAFDLTPEGVVKDQGSGVTAQSSGRKIEYVLIGLLIVSMGWVLYRVEVAPSEQVVEVVAEEAQQEVLPNSVAVLPFENLSPDPNNEYFAAGIHDELLTQLAKIADLTVIARTSVLRYPNSGKTIAEIAEELNVETIMEGTVRYAANLVRITVQLIDPSTGGHLWAETYEREFSVETMFAIESDIAVNIAMALEAELLPAERASIETAPTNSPEAYALYLKALDAGAFSMADETAQSYLDDALDLDPEFALALATKAAFLARTLGARIAWDANDVEEEVDEMEATISENAMLALQLDPGLGIAHLAIALSNAARWREAEASEAFELALKLSPNDPLVLDGYSRFSTFTGDSERAIQLGRRNLEVNPSSTEALIYAYLFSGDLDAAAVIGAKGVVQDRAIGLKYFNLGEIEYLRGNIDVALENLQLWEQLEERGGSGQIARGAQIYSLLGRYEDAERLFAQQQARGNRTSPAQAALAFLAVGRQEESLALFQRAVANGVQGGDTLTHLVKYNLWNDPILDQPEFVEVRSRLGFRE